MRPILFSGLLLFIIQLQAASPVAGTPFTTYRFPADQCRIIEHDLSRIFVPANCFYLDDALYQGEVRLDYREFLDQLDIVINDIPMAYSAAGEDHTLESGGMFELHAYAADGRPLRFAPGKKSMVQLATRFPDTKGLENFYFDRDQNNWMKQTPFASNPASNEPVSDKTDSLWEDDNWNYDMYWEGDWNFNGNQAANTTVNVEAIRDRNFRTLQVDQMGIYNCDRVLDEETVPLLASFTIENTKAPLQNYVYVVYKNKNSLFYYYPEKQVTLKLLPGEPVAMFVFGNDGSIAAVDPTYLASFDVRAHANQPVTFQLKKLPGKPMSKAELAELTGL